MNEIERKIDEETLRLMRFLVRAGRMTETLADDLLGTVDLTATRLMALHQIDQSAERLSLGALALCMSFVKSNATQVIDRMEEDQLVRRLPDPCDRRGKLIEMTDEGKRLHDAALSALAPLADKLQTLSPEERTQLLGLLQKLSGSMQG